MPDCNLVVIYGPPLAGKSSVAWELARRMGNKSAIVSGDGLLGGAIVVPDIDSLAELDMVTIQIKLMTANYLKNRYHTVVEAPFYYERDGGLYSFESDVDQLLALMRTISRQELMVRLDAPGDVLRRRAIDAGREADADSIVRLRDAYKPRYSDRLMHFDTSQESVAEIVEQVLERLRG
jgi:adenylate kinase family enzyme